MLHLVTCSEVIRTQSASQAPALHQNSRATVWNNALHQTRLLAGCWIVVCGEMAPCESDTATRTDFDVLLNYCGDILLVANNLEVHVKFVIWFLLPTFGSLWCCRSVCVTALSAAATEKLWFAVCSCKISIIVKEEHNYLMNGCDKADSVVFSLVWVIDARTKQIWHGSSGTNTNISTMPVVFFYIHTVWRAARYSGWRLHRGLSYRGLLQPKKVC